jgi:hypothetical protein
MYLGYICMYVHVCVCMNTNLNKIWLSMECSYVYVYVCMHLYVSVFDCFMLIRPFKDGS